MIMHKKNRVSTLGPFTSTEDWKICIFYISSVSSKHPNRNIWCKLILCPKSFESFYIFFSMYLLGMGEECKTTYNMYSGMPSLYTQRKTHTQTHIYYQKNICIPLHLRGPGYPGFSTKHAISGSYTAHVKQWVDVNAPWVGEMFVKASFISTDKLNAPRSKGRFGASLYVTEEITEIILPTHKGIL